MTDWAGGESLRPFLELAGADPRADPEEYDRLQREITRVWDAGGSLRAWAERVRAERRSLPPARENVPAAEPLTWQEAMAQLRRRYASP